MKPGIMEILIVVVLLVVFFGAKKLPSIGKNLGQGWMGFKKGLKEAKEEAGLDEVEKDVKNEVKETKELLKK